MRKIIIKKAFTVTFFISILIGILPAQNSELQEFISGLKKDLEGKNYYQYINAFSPKLRKKENKILSHKFDSLNMNSISVIRAYIQEKGEERADVYFHVFFQNSYSVITENWHLILIRGEKGWQITEKEVVGKKSHLYRIKIPSERVEKVKYIEVSHVDIKLTFHDALVFYDNIPQSESALLIIGEGEVYFSPSPPIEKHILELMYKKKYLKDQLNYAYLRFSDYFFENNIKIKKYNGEQPSITQVERNKAYSLFSEYYVRSFTVKNSINGELLSFLPQGEEAVFGFEGEDIGKYTYIYSPFSQEEVILYQREEERIVNLYSPSSTQDERRLFISFTQMFDIRDYRIDLSYDPHKYYFSGKAEVEIESKVETLNGVKFKINPNLEILRIMNDQGKELFYTQDELRKTLYVYFIHPPSNGERITVKVYYRGKIEQIQKSSKLVEVYSENSSVSIFNPRYETYLYTRNSYWYPSPAEDDYFTATLNIIVPSPFQVLSNGELVEKGLRQDQAGVEGQKEEQTVLYKFEIKDPVKYLSFLVGKLKKIKKNSSFFPPLQYFRSIEVPSIRMDVLEEAQKILQFYKNLFGEFPFSKLDFVHRQWPTSGGHSSASLVVLNILPGIPHKYQLIKTSNPVELSQWKEYYLAHEIAHQWWGQGITWQSYHDQWISEGLAQFSAALYLREKYGQKAFSKILKKFSKWTKKKHHKGPITLGSRISYFDFKAFQAVVYNKSCLVLNMLRELVGDDDFYKGLEEFFKTYKYGEASTYDFFRTFRKLTSHDLEGFFENWYQNYKLPEIKVSHRLKKVSDGYLLTLKVKQLKESFVFPLWVEWEEKGDKVRKKVIVKKGSQEFLLKMNYPPANITVNPNHMVPATFH